jgi:hypothetical protein
MTGADGKHFLGRLQLKPNGRRGGLLKGVEK